MYLYCPKCGVKNSDENEYCENCRESLKDILNWRKKSKPILYLIITLLGCLLIVLILNWLYTPLFTFIIVFVILLLISLGILGVSDKIYTKKGKFCPKCQQSNFNEEYCIHCGYELKNILGYFPRGSIKTSEIIEVEINTKYIKIYGNVTPPGLSNSSSLRRLKPITYHQDKISNIQITDHKGIIFSGYCLSFNYEDEDRPEYHDEYYKFINNYVDGKTIKVPIDAFFIPKLEEIIAMGIFNGKNSYAVE